MLSAASSSHSNSVQVLVGRGRRRLNFLFNREFAQAMDGFQDELFREAGEASEGLFDAQLALPLEFVQEPVPFHAIVKRDGRQEPFARHKIADTILLAAAEAGGL